MEKEEIIQEPRWTWEDCIQFNCAYCNRIREPDKYGAKVHCMNQELKGMIWRGECGYKKKQFGDEFNVTIPDFED